MKTPDQQIKDINGKLKQLISKYTSLLKENKRLSDDLTAAREINTNNQEIINRLQTEIGILKSSANLLTGEEKRKFENQINQYLKTIDNCMAILNK
jgi:F0F1-type ATP synthase membrane subunit b/b'